MALGRPSHSNRDTTRLRAWSSRGRAPAQVRSGQASTGYLHNGIGVLESDLMAAQAEFMFEGCGTYLDDIYADQRTMQAYCPIYEPTKKVWLCIRDSHKLARPHIEGTSPSNIQISQAQSRSWTLNPITEALCSRDHEGPIAPCYISQAKAMGLKQLSTVQSTPTHGGVPTRHPLT